MDSIRFSSSGDLVERIVHALIKSVPIGAGPALAVGLRVDEDSFVRTLFRYFDFKAAGRGSISVEDEVVFAWRRFLHAVADLRRVLEVASAAAVSDIDLVSSIRAANLLVRFFFGEKKSHNFNLINYSKP